MFKRENAYYEKAMQKYFPENSKKPNGVCSVCVFKVKARIV